jgi:hypothetical protein
MAGGIRVNGHSSGEWLVKKAVKGTQLAKKARARKVGRIILKVSGL